ncbi:hypothetical protein H5410_040667 [Solanum commersonii]|uniref:Uncharacterized protein n=1 Tax=Solanum commersonii TaxID=4109 RepID=A0A9J5XPL4_SOLCO|nr:hypothetical protein H5410_040667 [Solanum commersonii]
MKHMTTGTQGGMGRLKTHLRKCNKKFARLDDIERANRNGISIPENPLGVGGSNMVQKFKNRCKECGLAYRKVPKEVCIDEILYLKCLKLLIFIKSRYN